MTIKTDTLYEQLRRGPAILMLGQNYLKLETGEDSFLSEILRKYTRFEGESPSYFEILDSEAAHSVESSLAWMHQRCGLLSIPDWLSTVSSFGWSALYTSAIDDIWPKAFRTGWRELQPLFEEKFKPSDPRNRTRLHCTYLFGSVSRAEENERPPLTRFTWLSRKQTATALARRLPEIVTPLGTLVLEGYAGDKDWFQPEELFPILDQLEAGQAHLFNATASLSGNTFLAELINRGKLVAHEESLSAFLIRGENAGALRLSEPAYDEEVGHRVTIGNAPAVIPLPIWNQISKSAIVLDDAVLARPTTFSDERRYVEFRNFLSESSNKPIWNGYANGFAFTREFEIRLRQKVQAVLSLAGLADRPIILHGQTGTGKTVALGSLAFSIRSERKHPVLFIERKPQRPINSDIDVFCKWAEDQGAPSTLIVWDGMLEVEQYEDLTHYLSSRGRKTILVGSCYHQGKKVRKADTVIEAPAALTENELSDFESFLNKFDPSLSNLVDLSKQHSNQTFLVALYRLLPPTRNLIRSGIVREVGFAEQEIYKRSQRTELKPQVGALGLALLKAGLGGTSDLSDLFGEREVAGEKTSGLEELIGLIMVPGRFGLRVPIELLLRALGKNAFSNFVDLLREVDIFRWYEDNSGNISVGPRHPLEARLLAQARLGGAKGEVAYAKNLLKEVRDDAEFPESPELNFAVDLVRSIGPNGADVSYFAPYFQEISQTLTELRCERDVQIPRLMLQEASLLRESVMRRSQAGSPAENAITTLSTAEGILREALSLLADNPRTRKLQGFILVELASNLGTKAIHLLEQNADPQEIVALYRELRDQVMQARRLDPEGYYPIDVMAWATKSLLETNVLSIEARTEAEADILHLFEMADSEDLGDQQERFESRRYVLGLLLKKRDLSEDAFNKLLAAGSSAGFYLKAYDIVKEINFEEVLSDAERRICQMAVSYLEENMRFIEHDGRALYLLLRLWWASQTGKPMFYEERQSLAFSEQQWEYLFQLLIKLMSVGEEYLSLSLKYLTGLAAFHLGDIEYALEVFRELERESEYTQGRRRVIRSYLASNPDGSPRVFSGTVSWVNEERSRGEIYVQEIRRNIRFIPRDFNRPTIQKQEALNGFHIAFNFIGLIIDPLIFSRSNRGTNNDQG